jgi:hypothetical protein
MRTTKNSDRLREILNSTHNQIVALKDIKIAMLSVNSAIAENIEQQIKTLEDVYKHQLTLVNSVTEIEPSKNGWFSGHIKTKEERLNAILD